MKFYSLLPILAALTTSCVHVYYAPNTANAPLLSEAGETRINALYSTGINISSFNGGEIQVAHAVSKNIGVMVNGFAGGESESVSDWTSAVSHTEKGNGSYIEFGAGYFKMLQEKSDVMAELYGGVGFGTVNNDYGGGDHSKVNHTKIFLQPALGYKGKNVELTFIPKISLVNFHVKENQINNQYNEDEKGDVNSIADKKHFLALEPALVLRGGGEDFKAQVALSFTGHQLSSFASPNLITFNLSLGISINIKTQKK